MAKQPPSLSFPELGGVGGCTRVTWQEQVYINPLSSEGRRAREERVRSQPLPGPLLGFEVGPAVVHVPTF